MESNPHTFRGIKNFKIKVIALMILAAVEIFLFLTYGDLWRSNQAFPKQPTPESVLLVIFGIILVGMTVGVISMIHTALLKEAGLSHETYQKKWKAPMTRWHKTLIVGLIVLGIVYAVWMYFFYQFPH